MSGKQLRLADLPVHESGLRLMDREYAAVSLKQRHIVDLPPCCPISHNPMSGSTLAVTYRPVSCVLEVYSLRALVQRFRGGFTGTGRYPAERNMEGMIQLIAQMCADALGVRVRTHADLVLDTGPLILRCTAEPR